MEQPSETWNQTAEEAVRRYLNFLADPASARDDERIDELERRLAESQDPIERIKLASDLYRAENVDAGEFREDFIRHARDWAAEHGIVMEAFLQQGVPQDDLREAGFPVGRSGSGERRSAGTGTGTRAPRVSVEEIREKALRIDGPFTISELRDLAGGTPATVRKALDGLQEEGRIVDLGPDRNWGGRGRAPHLYRRS